MAGIDLVFTDVSLTLGHINKSAKLVRDNLLQLPASLKLDVEISNRGLKCNRRSFTDDDPDTARINLITGQLIRVGLLVGRID